MSQIEAAFQTALDQTAAALPGLVGAIIVLIAGWIIAGIAARVVTAGIRKAGVDRLFLEAGGGDQLIPSVATGEIVKWLVRLAAVLIAASLVGLAQVGGLFNAIVLWLPNVIVAVIILLVAPVLGKFLRSLIEVGAGQAGFSNARVLGRVVEIAVMVFAVLIAVNQVGIAADLIQTLFTGIVAAFAIAFGLAFGMGGRGVAEKMTEGWYSASKETARKISKVMDEADRA
ncbi:MAG: hypothetical protein ABIQ17_00330 [Candidatus Limnocylindrales bacterium]